MQHAVRKSYGSFAVAPGPSFSVSSRNTSTVILIKSNDYLKLVYRKMKRPMCNEGVEATCYRCPGKQILSCTTEMSLFFYTPLQFGYSFI
uniref:Uncharacterized protein n=1 Tax=Romanomermis culicivorax TaxID=13658 RepID=A0A915K972_ROMCU